MARLQGWTDGDDAVGPPPRSLPRLSSIDVQSTPEPTQELSVYPRHPQPEAYPPLLEVVFQTRSFDGPLFPVPADTMSQTSRLRYHGSRRRSCFEN
ncbi:hypothetical protein HMN09_01423600 [Mycena chlorophos]|uniref:Uncharacterized protein n=1 Tax=Mycena chlorophos TaxID=658473 RepID=A0A8H6VTY7_MYCCL|nr:hypothetical protein HMN09_01423600 [Mycena chlorophos]